MISTFFSTFVPLSCSKEAPASFPGLHFSHELIMNPEF